MSTTTRYRVIRYAAFIGGPGIIAALFGWHIFAAMVICGFLSAVYIELTLVRVRQLRNRYLQRAMQWVENLESNPDWIDFDSMWQQFETEFPTYNFGDLRKDEEEERKRLKESMAYIRGDLQKEDVMKFFNQAWNSWLYNERLGDIGESFRPISVGLLQRLRENKLECQKTRENIDSVLGVTKGIVAEAKDAMLSKIFDPVLQEFQDTTNKTHDELDKVSNFQQSCDVCRKMSEILRKVSACSESVFLLTNTNSSGQEEYFLNKGDLGSYFMIRLFRAYKEDATT